MDHTSEQGTIIPPVLIFAATGGQTVIFDSEQVRILQPLYQSFL
jgi:hypothetical protein